MWLFVAARGSTNGADGVSAVTLLSPLLPTADPASLRGKRAQSSGSCLPAAPHAQPLGVGVLWGGWLLAARGSAARTASGGHSCSRFSCNLALLFLGSGSWKAVSSSSSLLSASLLEAAQRWAGVGCSNCCSPVWC